jgi:xanthine/uracil permease
MLIANLVDFVDSLGCFAGVSRMSREKMSEDQVNKALFTETAISTFSVIFGNVPTTSYAQNVAVLSQTRIASKKMIATGGIMLIVLGLIYPLGVLVISIPQAVYGGALLMTFGMLTLVGVEILRDIKWTEENRVITAFALGSGLICVFLPDKWLNSITPALGLLLSSPPILSVLITIIITVVYRALE